MFGCFSWLENEVDAKNKPRTVLNLDIADDLKISDNIVYRQDDIIVTMKSEQKLRRRSLDASESNCILRRLDILEAIQN